MKIYFPVEIMDNLGDLSRKRGMSIPKLVVVAVAAYLKQEECSNERTESPDKTGEEGDITSL